MQGRRIETKESPSKDHLRKKCSRNEPSPTNDGSPDMSSSITFKTKLKFWWEFWAGEKKVTQRWTCGWSHVQKWLQTQARLWFWRNVSAIYFWWSGINSRGHHVLHIVSVSSWSTHNKPAWVPMKLPFEKWKKSIFISSSTSLDLGAIKLNINSKDGFFSCRAQPVLLILAGEISEQEEERKQRPRGLPVLFWERLQCSTLDTKQQLWLVLWARATQSLSIRDGAKVVP